MFDVYKPSGAFGVVFIPILLVLLAVGIGLAYLYQLLLEWIPFIYITFILTIIFGACLGAFGRLVVKTGKVRNVTIALIIGLVIGCGSHVAKFWFQYERILWEVAEFNAAELKVPVETAHKMARQEFTFWTHIEMRVEMGWELNGGAPISGVFVYLIWLIEAGIVLGLSIALPLSASKEPFSEKIGQWASEENAIMMLPIDNEEMVNQIRQATNVDDLLTIPIPKSDETNQFAVYTVNSIAGHELEDAYLTVKLTVITFDKDGNEQKKETPLVKYAILTSDQLAQLNENAELLNEAIAAYQQAKYSETPEEAGAEDEGTSEGGEDEFEQQ